MPKKIILSVILALGLSVSVTSLGTEGERAHSGDSLIGIQEDLYLQYLQPHLSLDRAYTQGDTVFFLVTREEKREVEALNVPFIEKSLPKDLSGESRIRAMGDINGLYHSYAQVNDVLNNLQIQYPNLAHVFSIGRTIEGRELNIIKISDNVQADESGNEPSIYIVGCHHAREWISVEVPLLFAQHLLANYATDPNIRKAIDGAEIYIQPLLNPDGLEYTIHTYRYWRKNRRYNGGLSWGVDLNRNYGYMWGYDDLGSSPDPDSEIYRGITSFSEPETAAVRDFLLAHPPDGSLSFHNFGQHILYSWAYTDDIFTPHEFEMKDIAAGMAQRMQAVNGTVYDYGSDILYITNGDTTDWIYGTFATPAFTIELPPDYSVFGGFFTGESMINLAFSENLPAMLFFVNYIVDKANGVLSPTWEEAEPDSPAVKREKGILQKQKK